MTVETDTAPPSFDTLKLSEPIRRAVNEVGYKSPTPVQLAAFEPISQGRDIIVQSKTGSGKTAAFALPLLDRVVTPDKRVQAMVLCPTRELAIQVANEVKRLGKYREVFATAIYGGAPMGRQIDELQAGAQIVVGTPGRVLDHLRRGTLDPSGIKCVCLDEADEMLSMGFAEELNAILELMPKKRQGLLFSATMPEQIQRMSRRHLHEPEFITLSSDSIAPSEVTHYVYFVGTASRARELVRILEVEQPEGALVFCNTRDDTATVSAELQRAGLAADHISGDLEQSARERVLGSFRAGQIKYLVATDVAARGIDVSNVTHVINYGFPESAESYVHRTGRTGRAGRRGTAVSLIGPQDVGNLYFLRLTYGIRPIERSLPSSAEERTRREIERIQLLREAFTQLPGEDAVSLARRLLAHDDAETLVASLLGEFFGMATRQAIAKMNAPQQPQAAREEPAAQAPATAQAQEPARAPAPRERAERSDRGERGDRGPRGERGRERRNDRPERSGIEARGPRPERAERAEREETPAPAAAASAPTLTPAGEAAPEAPTTLTSAEEPRAPRVRERRRGPLTPPGVPAPAGAPQERPRRIDVHHGGDVPYDDESPEAGMEEIRLAVGRRDSIRAGDIARLVREKGNLARRDVGRIFVRDRFSLVSVRAELVDATIAALKDATLNERPLEPERGKGLNPSLPPPPDAGEGGEEGGGN